MEAFVNVVGRSEKLDGPPRFTVRTRQPFRYYPVHKPLTAGEISFAETHRYREATANRCHSPGTPLSL